MNMHRRAGRLSDPSADVGIIVAVAGFFALIMLVVMAWSAAWFVGLDPDPVILSWVIAVVSGGATWSVAATMVFAALLLGVAVAVVTVTTAVVRLRRRGGGSRSDHLARSMSRASDFHAITQKDCAAVAERLHVASECGAGVPIGKSVLTSCQLLSCWEWTQLWIMGPRAGKTSCLAVPQMISTGGPVLATSNKPDLVHLAQGPRSDVGLVRVHDPQQLVSSTPPQWYWDPLSYIDGNITHAEQLVSLFSAASRDVGARTDAFFDVAGNNLLAVVLLAASVSDKTTLYDARSWLQNPEDETPEDLLYYSGYHREASELRSNRERTERQRDGVYATAENLLGWLKNPLVEQWITPGDGRVAFDPSAFVRSSDTLFLMSKEGAGSTRALTSALTVAVTDAAEMFAIEQGGRLQRPLLCTLDEAANVCRWPQLPDLFSHYGSRGIILTVFLQSLSQGHRVWGKEGMTQMWDAANIRGIGRGIADAQFADQVSRLIGDHDVRTRSKSVGAKNGSSTSHQLRREKIFDAADVVALEQGRAIIFPAGSPPVLVALQHWSAGDKAQAVTASEQHYSGVENE